MEETCILLHNYLIVKLYAHCLCYGGACLPSVGSSVGGGITVECLENNHGYANPEQRSGKFRVARVRIAAGQCAPSRQPAEMPPCQVRNAVTEGDRAVQGAAGNTQDNYSHCGFNYNSRDVPFSTTYPDDFLVLQRIFSLQPNGERWLAQLPSVAEDGSPLTSHQPMAGTTTARRCRAEKWAKKRTIGAAQPAPPPPARPGAGKRCQERGRKLYFLKPCS